MEELVSMRIDMWLKVTRIFKQRSKAADAVEAGHVKLNGDRVRHGKLVKIGDVLTVRKEHEYFEYTILGLAPKPIRADLARELYEIKEKHVVEGEYAEIFKQLAEMDAKEKRKHRGKLNKKERRTVLKNKYGE